MVKKNGEIVDNYEEKKKRIKKIMKIITGIVLLIVLGYNEELLHEIITDFFS